MAVGACKTAFTPSTGVRIPLGTPNEIKGLHKNAALFSYVGQICPTLCVTREMVLIKTRNGFDRTFDAKSRLGIYFA